MTDFAEPVTSRNLALPRATDCRHLSELLRIGVSLSSLAVVLVFYAWVRCETVSIGYEQQVLQQQEQELGRQRVRLVVQEETLKTPERVERIAREELGMTLIRANQILAPAATEFEAGAATRLALADTGGIPNPQRRNGLPY